jgi:hypothetical protein
VARQFVHDRRHLDRLGARSNHGHDLDHVATWDKRSLKSGIS